MIECPHCRKLLPLTAVRCRHCRKTVWPSARKKMVLPAFPAGRYFDFLRLPVAEERVPAWGWFEVVVCFSLFFLGIWWVRRENVGFEWVEWFRQNFFVFTREPLLQIYVYIFIETFFLKSGFVLVIFLILSARREPIFQSLALTLPSKNDSRRFLFVFFILCLAVAWWEGMDPLTPDLPTPLFFQESAVIGNILAVLSLAIVAPITEEIIFRGFMYPVFSSIIGRWASVFLISILFAAVHAPQMQGSYESLPVIFAVGLLLTWQRARTGSTLYTIGLHALYNFSLTAVGFLRFCFYGF